MEKAELMGDNKRPKYIDIIDAVNRLVSVRSSVEKLCDDICGIVESPSPKSEKPPERRLCLLEVLENIPGDIKAECNMIEKVVEEIRAQIL